MAELVMDRRSIAATLRQRWRSIAAMAAVGAALGAVYVTRVPLQLSSTTLVTFPSSASLSPNSGQEPITDTQVHIVNSTPVLDRAGKSLRPALSGTQVQQRVRVDALTDVLIRIRAFSTDAGQAQKLSEAVAQAYIATLKDRLTSLSGIPPDLKSRAAILTKQLNDLRGEIAATAQRQRGEPATSSNGIRDAQLLAELVNDQTDLTVRLDKVRDAAAQASNVSVQIPYIAQNAAPATGPSLARRDVTWAVSGALLAAAATALLLLIRRRRDPRVRARDDLADAVGSRVLAAIRGRPQRSVAGWLTLFQTYEPSPEEAWAFRQVLRALVGPPDSRDATRTGSKASTGRIEHPRSLTVIALSADQRAVAVGPQLAVFAASLGISTRFVIASRHDSVASLAAACATDRAAALPSGLVLETGPSEDIGPASTGHPESPVQGVQSADLTIVSTVADRREPTLDRLPATAVTLLAVSPGVATRDDLARLAVAVDDTGRRIDGVVVADRDPSDRTSGRHMLDERVVQPALPIRMTGLSQVSPPASTRSRA